MNSYYYLAKSYANYPYEFNRKTRRWKYKTVCMLKVGETTNPTNRRKSLGMSMPSVCNFTPISNFTKADRLLAESILRIKILKEFGDYVLNYNDQDRIYFEMENEPICEKIIARFDEWSKEILNLFEKI